MEQITPKTLDQYIKALMDISRALTSEQSLEDILKLIVMVTAKEMARKLGLVSMASVPLQVRDGKVIGVLSCFTSYSHDFSETEVNLITTVAEAVILSEELE